MGIAVGNSTNRANLLYFLGVDRSHRIDRTRQWVRSILIRSNAAPVMETVTMARAIYTLMIVLMVLWSAALAVDLVQGLLASGVFAAPAAEQSVVQTAQSVYRSLLSDLWSPAAQARAIVWGLPMIVFALIAAISQR